MKLYNVAIVGASGAVGEEILRIFEEIEFPSPNCPSGQCAKCGKLPITFNDKELVIKELTPTVFEEEGIEIALFSAGGSVSAEFAPYAAAAGAVVIDNTSHFRMFEDVPLVVPEVNPEDIAQWKNTRNHRKSELLNHPNGTSPQTPR
jgi:aspartate-semialdehyde dehydrogenase